MESSKIKVEEIYLEFYEESISWYEESISWYEESISWYEQSISWYEETGYCISRTRSATVHLSSMSCESESGDAFNDTLGSF